MSKNTLGLMRRNRIRSINGGKKDEKYICPFRDQDSERASGKYSRGLGSARGPGRGGSAGRSLASESPTWRRGAMGGQGTCLPPQNRVLCRVGPAPYGSRGCGSVTAPQTDPGPARAPARAPGRLGDVRGSPPAVPPDSESQGPRPRTPLVNPDNLKSRGRGASERQPVRVA